MTYHLKVNFFCLHVGFLTDFIELGIVFSILLILLSFLVSDFLKHRYCFFNTSTFENPSPHNVCDSSFSKYLIQDTLTHYNLWLYFENRKSKIWLFDVLNMFLLNCNFLR